MSRNIIIASPVSTESESVILGPEIEFTITIPTSSQTNDLNH